MRGLPNSEPGRTLAGAPDNPGVHAFYADHFVLPLPPGHRFPMAKYARLRERLAQAHQRVGQALESLGFDLFCEPKAGMFLWARHPEIQNATDLAYQAAEQDILLGPGHLFDPELQPSPWFRFNVAFTDDPRVLSFLSDHRHAG